MSGASYPSAWATLRQEDLQIKDYGSVTLQAMTGMAMACFYEGDWKFEGLESLRVKECDRIQAMVDGFTQLGITTEVVGDDVTIRGGAYWQTSENLAKIQASEIETNSHDDHRIAMCFGILRSALAKRPRELGGVKNYLNLYK